MDLIGPTDNRPCESGCVSPKFKGLDYLDAVDRFQLSPIDVDFLIGDACKSLNSCPPEEKTLLKAYMFFLDKKACS
jgi:hypothetical protein